MRESSSETITTAPKVQKLERRQTIEKEHKDALERAISLNVPYAVPASEDEKREAPQSETEDVTDTKLKSTGGSGRINWEHVVQKLFKKSESGDLVLYRDSNALN